MGNVGRFCCVSLPLLMTVAALVAMLIATLSGVAHNNLYLLKVETKDLTIDKASVENIVASTHGPFGHDSRDAPVSENITASTLGLADSYEINLWGFCSVKDGKRTCEKAHFNWAAKALNTTYLETVGTEAHVRVKLPKEISESLKAFKTITKYTEIAFIVAIVALGLELIIGIFSNFSRAISCLTWLEASITTVLVFTASGLATGMAAVVVGAIEASDKFYGAHGKINTSFLATIWIGAAFALGANLFWLFTICCCKPEHRSRDRSHRDSYHDGEKLLPTRGYAPLGNDHEMTGYNNHHTSPNPYNSSSTAQRYPNGSGRTDLAYEPYSHRA